MTHVRFTAQLEEDVNPPMEPPVIFIDTEPEKEISVTARVIKAAQEKPAAPIKVKVAGNYRVVHDGKPFIGGDVLEIPDDAEHKIWLQSGWVTKEN